MRFIWFYSSYLDLKDAAPLSSTKCPHGCSNTANTKSLECDPHWAYMALQQPFFHQNQRDNEKGMREDDMKHEVNLQTGTVSASKTARVV